MLPHKKYFASVPCPDNENGVCWRPHCQFFHEFRNYDSSRISHASSASIPAELVSAGKGDSSAGGDKRLVHPDSTPEPCKLSISNVKEDPISKSDRLLDALDVSDDRISEIDGTVEDDRLQIDENIDAQSSSDDDITENASCKDEANTANKVEQVDKSSLSNVIDASTLSETLLQSDVLQKLVSDAVKKYISENQCLSDVDPAYLISKINTKEIAESLTEGKKAKNEHVSKKRRLYLPPPGIPDYKPTPISELERRKQARQERDSNRKESEENEPMTDFSSCEDDVEDDRAKMNSEFDMLEEVLAEKCQKNCEKYNTKEFIKKKRAIGKSSWSMSSNLSAEEKNSNNSESKNDTEKASSHLIVPAIPQITRKTWVPVNSLNSNTKSLDMLEAVLQVLDGSSVSSPRTEKDSKATYIADLDKERQSLAVGKDEKGASEVKSVRDRALSEEKSGLDCNMKEFVSQKLDPENVSGSDTRENDKVDKIERRDSSSGENNKLDTTIARCDSDDNGKGNSSFDSKNSDCDKISDSSRHRKRSKDLSRERKKKKRKHEKRRKSKKRKRKRSYSSDGDSEFSHEFEDDEDKIMDENVDVKIKKEKSDSDDEEYSQLESDDSMKRSRPRRKKHNRKYKRRHRRRRHKRRRYSSSTDSSDDERRNKNRKYSIDLNLVKQEEVIDLTIVKDESSEEERVRPEVFSNSTSNVAVKGEASSEGKDRAKADEAASDVTESVEMNKFDFITLKPCKTEKNEADCNATYGSVDSSESLQDKVRGNKMSEEHVNSECNNANADPDTLVPSTVYSKTKTLTEISIFDQQSDGHSSSSKKTIKTKERIEKLSSSNMTPSLSDEERLLRKTRNSSSTVKNSSTTHRHSTSSSKSSSSKSTSSTVTTHHSSKSTSSSHHTKSSSKHVTKSSSSSSITNRDQHRTEDRKEHKLQSSKSDCNNSASSSRKENKHSSASHSSSNHSKRSHSTGSERRDSSSSGNKESKDINNSTSRKSSVDSKPSSCREGDKNAAIENFFKSPPVRTAVTANHITKDSASGFHDVSTLKDATSSQESEGISDRELLTFNGQSQESSNSDSEPELSALDDIPDEDWDMLAASPTVDDEYLKDEVADECRRIFDNFDHSTLPNVTQKKKRASETCGNAGAASYSAPPKVVRVARPGAMGNLLRKPNRSSIQALRKTPQQIMLERYAKLRSEGAQLQQTLAERKARLMGSSSFSSPGTAGAVDASVSGSSVADKAATVAATSAIKLGSFSAGVPGGPRKHRIGAATNVSAMLSASKLLKQQSSPPLPATSERTLATAGGFSIKRVAHVPKVEVLARPIVSSDFSNKVPQTVRQRYLNSFVDEALKFIESQPDAFSVAVAEEKVCIRRASSRAVYLSLAVNTIKRLRDHKISEQAQEMLKEKGFSSPSTPAASNTGSSSSLSNSRVVGGLSKNNMSSFPRPRVQSHFSTIAGGGQKGTWSIERPAKTDVKTKLESLKGAKFYQFVKRYLLTTEQLEENGYPRPHCDVKGKALVKMDGRKRVSPSPTERFCARCGELFVVDKWGFPTIIKSCAYHWGRAYKKRGSTGLESHYSCCGCDGESEGCCVASTHVSDNFNPDNLTGFVRTLPKEPDSSGDYGVYALDCEMCYTTFGSELTRITVIAPDNSIVYETFVMPENLILDYNTRFSGISEEDLKDVTTSLRDVQAALLTRFSANTILVGHSLESDLLALKIIHNTVIDTSVMFPHKMGPPFKRALRNLASEYLKKIIQNDVGGHDSAEDAITCMELLHWKIKEDLKTTTVL